MYTKQWGMAAFVLMAALSAQGQNSSPYWSLAGNSNASTSPAKLGTTNSTSLGLFTSNTERIRITGGGNIGIGTGSPASRLSVNVPSGVSPFRTVIGGTTKLMVNSNGGLSVGSSSTPSPNGLFVNGFAGIGTNLPSGKLEVVRADNSFLIARFTNASTSGDLSALIDVRNGNGDMWRYGVGGAGNAWALTGGQFYIERVGSGPQMAINQSGQVGIGTTTPAAKLEVRRSDNGALLARFINANTTGDLTGLIDIRSGNGILWRYGVGGTGNGLGLSAGQFYIERAGAGALMTINQSGQVGIGTTNLGSYKMKIKQSSFGINLEYSASSNNWEIYSSLNNLSLYNNNNFKGSFSSVSGIYTAASDARLKTNIADMPAVLAKVEQLKPHTYQFREGQQTNTNALEYGFLAQEVKELFPHLVTHNLDPARNLDLYSVDYSGFGVLAIKAIQEMQAAKKVQDEEVASLKADIAALKEELAKLTRGNTTASLSGASLGLISPNPLRTSGRIAYAIPEGSNRAQLLVTDAAGKTVLQRTLTRSGTIELNTTQLAAGTYYYALLIDNQKVATQKMTVIR